MGTTVSTIGILMPNDFPVWEYDEMQRLVIKRNSKSAIDSVVLSQFLGGWNAVAHRFRATADHDQAFTRAVNSSQTRMSQLIRRSHLKTNIHKSVSYSVSSLQAFQY